MCFNTANSREQFGIPPGGTTCYNTGSSRAVARGRRRRQHSRRAVHVSITAVCLGSARCLEPSGPVCARKGSPIPAIRWRNPATSLGVPAAHAAARFTVYRRRARAARASQAWLARAGALENIVLLQFSVRAPWRKAGSCTRERTAVFAGGCLRADSSTTGAPAPASRRAFAGRWRVGGD